MQESGEVRILRGFLKGVHWSRITGSQIHPVRNATKSRACCRNDAPRAEKRDTDSKVLALPSELGNPHRTRVPTFHSNGCDGGPMCQNDKTRQNRKGLQILVQNSQNPPVGSQWSTKSSPSGAQEIDPHRCCLIVLITA